MISDLGSRNRVAMYTTFFRFFDLRNNPFNVNPDPEYLYLNQRTQALLDEMASAIQARQGLIVLSGEAGTGKTTLVNQLKQWLKEQQTATAFIFNPHLGVDELFELMIADFGIVTTQPRKGSSLGNINRWLQQQYRLGRNAVLFLDEAQGLPPHVLEQIRMLLNTEMPKEKILQIVLSGQPELEEKLRQPEMRQIRQRISLRCHTRPLTQQEAHAYIEKRLQVAGGNGQNIFAPEAIEAIHLYARGIPRVMNMLCEHAMMRAYQYQAETVLPYMVEEAANQLQFDDIKPVRTWPDPDGSPKEEPQYALADALFEPEQTEVQREEKHLAAAAGISSDFKSARATWLEITVGADPEAARRPVAVGESRNGKKKSEATLVSEIRTQPAARELRAVEVSEDESQFRADPQLDHPKGTVTAFPVKPDNNQISFDTMQRLQAWTESCGRFAKTIPGSIKSSMKSLPVKEFAGSVKGFCYRASSRFAGTCKEGASVAWEKAWGCVRSRQWDKSMESLVRWLQQPVPNVKIHRRAGHLVLDGHEQQGQHVEP
jgi:general secretion pathway protein A